MQHSLERADRHCKSSGIGLEPRWEQTSLYASKGSILNWELQSRKRLRPLQSNRLGGTEGRRRVSLLAERQLRRGCRNSGCDCLLGSTGARTAGAAAGASSASSTVVCSVNTPVSSL